MKVVAINGSPRKKGNTYQALNMVAEVLEDEGIEVEIIQLGTQEIKGCSGCNACFKDRNEKCIIKGDTVDEIIQKMKEADGFLLGSPVYWSGINGTMKSFLDRAFYVSGANGGLFRHKVGAAIVSVRRTGGIPAFQTLNQYFQYSEMFMPAANYWNVVHGNRPGEVQEDAEGKQIARVLAKNMAFLLKAVDQNKDMLPAAEQKEWTSFIR